MYVPKEIHEYILQFIDDNDKSCASMTCTLWLNILKDMFFRKYNKDTVPTECAYDLYLYLKYFECQYTLGPKNTHQYIKPPDIKISCTINCLNVLTIYGTQGIIDMHSILHGYIFIDHYSKYFEDIIDKVDKNKGVVLAQALWANAFNIADHLLDQEITIDVWVRYIDWWSGSICDSICVAIKYLKRKNIDMSVIHNKFEEVVLGRFNEQYMDLIKN